MVEPPCNPLATPLQPQNKKNFVKINSTYCQNDFLFIDYLQSEENPGENKAMTLEEELMHVQELHQVEAELNELKDENQRLRIKVGVMENANKYLKGLLEANFADYCWRSTRKSYPTFGDKEIVYNVAGNYRIGFWDHEKKAFVNKFNGRRISFVKVASWCYLDNSRDGFGEVPAKVRQAIDEYREERSRWANREEFDGDGDEIEIITLDGIAADDEYFVTIDSEGNVWINDSPTFSILNFIEVYKNGEKVEF